MCQRSKARFNMFGQYADLIAHHAFDPEGGKKSLLDTASAAASQARRPVSGASDPELDGQPVVGSDAPETVSAPLVPHFKPNLTIEVVDYFATSASGKIPPPMRDALVFDDNHDGYYPVVQSSEFWLLRVRTCRVTTALSWRRCPTSGLIGYTILDRPIRSRARACRLRTPPRCSHSRSRACPTQAQIAGWLDTGPCTCRATLCR